MLFRESWLQFSGDAGGKSRMIVLGEVPPSQPEQEQESAQDVAAQWLQSEDQKTTTTTTLGPGGVLAAPSRRKQDIPPVPQPRQRIVRDRPDVRVMPTRNRKSRRRRITVTGNHLHSSSSSISKYIRLYQHAELSIRENL